MILRASWQCAGQNQRDVIRGTTPLGPLTGWLEERHGKGSLALQVRVESDGGYIDPARFSALGALSFCKLPELVGKGSRLQLTAIPGRWLGAEGRLLAYLGRLQIKGAIRGRTLEIEDGSLSPSRLIERTGVALFAIDEFARSYARAVHVEQMRRAALCLFGASADEVLSLLDEVRGSRNLRNLFTDSNPPRDETRVKAIAAALAKIGTKTLVQFDCGPGWLLSQLGRAAGLEKAIGVEASASLVARAKSRYEGFLDVRHGSLIDPPPALPNASTALLVDSLSMADARLPQSAEVLFQKIGFDYILCIEGDASGSAQLGTWAESVASQFSYRQVSWKLGKGSAVLFRRTSQAPERKGVEPIGPRKIETRRGRAIALGAVQWESTIEAFGKWTVDPRWLVYLPPSMASLQAEQIRGPLEHPRDAFAYYRNQGISKVIVEFKHMGSRAIAVICRDEKSGERRFGIPSVGCIYTRNGRPFLKDETHLLASLSSELTRSRFWERFNTDWVCLDGELLPWTLKAERLLQDSHGELLLCGEAVIAELANSVEILAPEELLYLEKRRECFRRYRVLYEHYQSVDRAIGFAPFHLIATEGRAYFEKNHLWHMQTVEALTRQAGDVFIETPYRSVSLWDERAVKDCIRWWEKLSESGEEGVVVKPLYFVPRGRRGFAQPAIKCRGAEHLRLVYGPEYDLPENRLRLFDRPALKRRREKHRRVLRQFALSVEGVERFVRGDNLDRIAECVRGIIALESREY